MQAVREKKEVILTSKSYKKDSRLFKSYHEIFEIHINIFLIIFIIFGFTVIVAKF